MLDTLRLKIHSSTQLLLDTLQEAPILKGLVPAGVIATPSFINDIEMGLKITLLVLSIIVAGLTGYAKWLHIKNLKTKK